MHHLFIDASKICNHKFKKKMDRSGHNNKLNVDDNIINYVIEGASQQRPLDFNKLLASSSFKRSLIAFLVHHWCCSPELGSILGEKVLFVTEEHRCFSFRNVDGRMKRNDEESLNSYEEEADTRMLFHSMRSPKNVVFRTSDTDELIILLANMHRFDRNTHIWIEAGISSKNTLRYVDVNSIYHSFGDLLSRALTDG